VEWSECACPEVDVGLKSSEEKGFYMDFIRIILK